MALELLTGKSLSPPRPECVKINVAFVPLGTPLLAGPGAIVATMLFVQRVHTAARMAVSRSPCARDRGALSVAMRFCGVLQRVLHDSGVELLTRISGLLLSAIAVQLGGGAVRAVASNEDEEGRPAHGGAD